MDNKQSMESSSERGLVEGCAREEAIARTIQASNEGGNTSPILTTEEREELESRGINPFWERRKFLYTLKIEAKKNGIWLDNLYLADKELIHDQMKLGTSENDVYINQDNKTLTKINNLSYISGSEYFNSLLAFLDRIKSHNILFPDVAYTIIGFMDSKNGSPSMVLEQPFISNAVNATQYEINEYLAKNGFLLSSVRNWSNSHPVWSNGVYELFDARPANVLKKDSGKLYFIDVIPHSVEYMNTITC